MDLHFRFDKNFNCGYDRVSVSFTFSRMSLRTSHKALDSLAESHLGTTILAPTQKHIAHHLKANRKPEQSDLEDAQLSPWVNDSLNPEQQAAVQRIANGRL